MNSKLKFKKLLTILTTLLLCFSSFMTVHADTRTGTAVIDYENENVLAVFNPTDETDFLSYYPFVFSDGQAAFCSDENFWIPFLGSRELSRFSVLSGDGTILDKNIYNFIQSCWSRTPLKSGNYGNSDAYLSGSSVVEGLASTISTRTGYNLTLNDMLVATNYALHIIAGHQLTLDKLSADSIKYLRIVLGAETGDYSGLPENFSLSAQEAQKKIDAMYSLVDNLVKKYNTAMTNSDLHVKDWSSKTDFQYPYVDTKTKISLKLPTEFEGNTFEATVEGTTKIYQGSTTMVVAMDGARPALENLIKNIFPAASGITNVSVADSDIQSWTNTGDSQAVEVKFDKVTITVNRDKYTSWLLSQPTVTVPEQELNNGWYFDPVEINRTPQEYQGENYQDMVTPEVKQFKGVFFTVQVPDFNNETVITKTIAGESTPLAGVTIKLMDAQGNVVDRNARGEALNLTTDAQGKITLKNLPLGDYRYTETAVPAGYTISSKIYTFKVTSTGTVTDPTVPESTTEFENELTTTVLIKKDADTNQPLEGVKFEVYNTAGSKVKEGTTGPDGKITFKGLTGGESYTFREVGVPSGYIKAQDKVFAIKAKDTEQDQNVVEVTNQKTEVNILKADLADAAPVAGAKIVIRGVDNNFTHEATSDANGDFGLEKGLLSIGKYTFTETVAPDGYVLNETTFEFEIKEDGSIVSDAKTGDKELTITDEKLDITLNKVDSKDNTGVDGVEVEIYDNAAPEVKKTLTSADGGKLHFEVGDPFLKVGHTYTVKEKTAAPGYIVSNTEYTFTIANDGSITGTASTISNVPTHVILSKTEISTAAPVPGAKLSIYTLDDEPAATAKGVELVDLVTSAEGKVEFDYLPVGSYYFLETDAPEGYLLNPEKHHFTINPDGTVGGKSTLSDELNEVEYIKVDGETNDLLVGVEFELVDAEGNKVTRNVLGQKLNLVTDENGKLNFRGLEDGDYTLVETVPQDGYYIDQNPIEFSIVHENGSHEVLQVSPRITNAKTHVELKKLDVDGVNGVPGVKIELKDADGNKVTKNALGDDLVLVSDEHGKFEFEGLKIGVYSYKEVKVPHGYTVNQNEYTFEIKKNGSVVGNLEFENSKTHVEITKTDIADSAPIEGAEIEIYDENGDLVASYVSDKTGKLPIPDGTLAIGKYTFKETVAPSGYKLNETVFEFEIKEDGEIIGATEIKNEKTRVVLHKHDNVQDIPVSGAFIEVYDKDGNIVTDFAESYFTDEEGNVTIVGIPVGEYTWKEAIAPQGYILNKETKKFTIAPNGAVTGDVEMINTPNEIVVSKINSTKTPANAKPEQRVFVPGATLQFWKDGKEFGEYTTDANGQIKLVGIKPGVYTYREIKAPVGFELNTETYSFTIKADGAAEGVFQIPNKEVGLYLYKKSFTTGKSLANATFIVKDSSGNDVATGTSDSNGRVLIQTLKPGKYSIIEQQAPEGYVKTDQAYGFTINELGVVVEGDFTVYNKVKPSDDPSKPVVPTGFGQMTAIAGVVGLAALGSAIFLVAKKSKKED